MGWWFAVFAVRTLEEVFWKERERAGKGGQDGLGWGRDEVSGWGEKGCVAK